MRWMALLFVVISVSHADAQPQQAVEPEYPIEVVDRPLVMHAGMDEIGIGYSRDLVFDGEDASASRIFYAHSFGRLELIAQLNTDDASFIGVRFAPIPSLVIAFRFFGSGAFFDEGGTRYDRYRLGQSLRVGYRAVHVPQRFLLTINGGVFVSELFVSPDGSSLQDGVSTSADVGIAAHVQLTCNLSAFTSVTEAALVHSTAGVERGFRLSASGGLQLALRRWDFVAGAGVGDITDDQQLFMFAAIAFRW